MVAKVKTVQNNETKESRTQSIIINKLGKRKLMTSIQNYNTYIHYHFKFKIHFWNLVCRQENE